jgi:hypothetical protein
MNINTDYSERYRELHVPHMVLMQDRYRDQRLMLHGRLLQVI